MTTAPLPDIKALDRAALVAVVEGLGEPAYRARQLERWLHARGVRSFAEMTDLSTDLREALSRRFALSAPEISERQDSSDGTRKYLVSFADGVSVECVGIPEGRRLTVCFSTQAGCAMGCSFCATGRSGLVRALTCGEMVDQVRLVGDDFGQRVSGAVAMGQGEPFAVYDSVLAAMRFMNSPDGLEIGARHLTVSTCGLTDGIRRLGDEPEQFTLAVSLHSAVQKTRDALMPGVGGIPLTALREALARYRTVSGRRPTIEYALIAGVNDSDEERDALIDFLDGLHAHVNLIPVNPAGSPDVARPSEATVQAFVRRLAEAGVETSVRRERGSDIDAACGQLKQRRGA